MENLREEVIENVEATDIIESTGNGLAGLAGAGIGIALIAATGYGIYKLVKKFQHDKMLNKLDTDDEDYCEGEFTEVK